jgi:hypothetical protein
VCRVRWPVGYGEEREASHTCAAAALAKLADSLCSSTREPSENTTVGIPNVWTNHELLRRKRAVYVVMNRERVGELREEKGCNSSIAEGHMLHTAGHFSCAPALLAGPHY